MEKLFEGLVSTSFAQVFATAAPLPAAPASLTVHLASSPVPENLTAPQDIREEHIDRGTGVALAPQDYSHAGAAVHTHTFTFTEADGREVRYVHRFNDPRHQPAAAASSVDMEARD